MATRDENDRLTRIGPDTPMGRLLRRYWQPVGTEAELQQEPVQRVRLLGEDLTLFRSARGEYGLVDERCAHRCMALDLAQRAYVIVKGRILLTGTAAEIRKKGNLNQIYFSLAQPG